MIISVSNLTRHRLTLLFFSLITFGSLAACQTNEPKVISGLSVKLYNYSQDVISSVSINGKNTGVSIVDEAKIGEIKGGGQYCCSDEISALQNTFPVTVKNNHGDYITQSLLERPLPPKDMRGILVIHVLPGHKVVLEVASFATSGRRDLIEAQIMTLGLTQDVPFSDLLRTGPYKYID